MRFQHDGSVTAGQCLPRGVQSGYPMIVWPKRPANSIGTKMAMQIDCIDNPEACHGPAPHHTARQYAGRHRWSHHPAGVARSIARQNIIGRLRLDDACNLISRALLARRTMTWGYRDSARGSHNWFFIARRLVAKAHAIHATGVEVTRIQIPRSATNNARSLTQSVLLPLSSAPSTEGLKTAVDDGGGIILEQLKLPHGAPMK